MRSCMATSRVHPASLVFPGACGFQGPRSLPETYRSTASRLCFISDGVDRVSSFTIRPSPYSLLPQLAGTSITMSTGSSDGKESSISRREKIARAAEQRLREKAMDDTTNSSRDDSSRSTGDDGPRKRQASSREGGTSQQIGFSDSDGSDAEVACLGVSRVGHGLIGKKEGDKSEVAKAEEAAGAARKRGRKHQPDPAALAAMSATLNAGVERLGEASAKGKSTGGIPKMFRIVSWNIDCLNPESKQSRVEEVCAIILGSEERQLPDVILLQEVDVDMMSILNARLGAGDRYRAHPSRAPLEKGYFTLMYVRVGTVEVHSSAREDFPTSLMGRDLTKVSCTFNGKPLLVMTAHLESEKQSSDERKAQFHQALRALLSFREGPAIFAGDTNLREAEVKQEKLAKEAGDVWQIYGADPACRFTWDTQKNDNLVFGGGFKPRARYDRMFVNQVAKAGVRSFSLLGTEKMAPPELCFPSDHFGIDACFQW